jgi:tetratricopeptide (TPR) repeat protein
MKSGKWREARQALEQYERANPGHGEVSRVLLDVYREQGDFAAYCQACRRLVENEPDNPDLRLMLAGGYMNDTRLASALRAFHEFLERWPDDPRVGGARESLEHLESAVDELLRDLGLTGDDGLECAVLNEEVIGCLNADDWPRAVHIGEQLLARAGDFVPAVNNVSEAHFRAGQADRAIALSRRALRLRPDSVHALANLTRYLFLTGRHHEAEEAAEQLRAARAEHADAWYKKCEALSFLGNDKAVLAVFTDAVRAGAVEQPTAACALLCHVGAVALARQGDLRQADRYWRKAQSIRPNLDLVQENLADAAEPASRRHGPWYFSLSYWGCEKAIDALGDCLDRSTREKSDEAVERTVRRFAEAHPEVVRLVPALLDRGDRAAREFAWRLAALLKTPEMLEALRGFCQSQRGPDAMRTDAVTWLRTAGVLSPGTVRMWIDGQWRDIELFGFDVTTEPVGPKHGPPVDDLAYEGYEALRRGKGADAEALFRKCIDLEGESPDLLNNLAASYDQQGRTDKSCQLARHIHERWPDYFFGRIAMANMATIEGDFERAEHYLAPLCRQQRLHITEFSALAAAKIHLLLGRGALIDAQNWLDMWRNIDPDHPGLRAAKSRYDSVAMAATLRKSLFGRRR